MRKDRWPEMTRTTTDHPFRSKPRSKGAQALSSCYRKHVENNRWYDTLFCHYRQKRCNKMVESYLVCIQHDTPKYWYSARQLYKVLAIYTFTTNLLLPEVWSVFILFQMNAINVSFTGISMMHRMPFTWMFRLISDEQRSLGKSLYTNACIQRNIYLVFTLYPITNKYAVSYMAPMQLLCKYYILYWGTLALCYRFKMTNRSKWSISPWKLLMPDSLYMCL